MLPINLISMYQAYNSLSQDDFHNYINAFGIKLDKEQEILDLLHFIEMVGTSVKNHAIFNDFYVGYTIPQISKEFDLLRLGKNFHLNIEIKHTSTEEKIQKQLRMNRYYLHSLCPNVFVFSYIVSTQMVYTINENGELYNISIDDLRSFIREQQVEVILNLDELFSPKQYLVSPLNSTDQFINKRYFLNGQQDEFKKDILQGFDKEKLRCVLITGKPGTGKTLLTYDIAQHYREQSKKIIIIHCGTLSNGHLMLRSKYQWPVFEIKHFSFALENINRDFLIVIDEAQRVFRHQLEEIIDIVSQRQAKCVLSFDPEQFISSRENKGNLEEMINGILPYKQYVLSEKIRSNKEIASFIMNLFDKSRINTDPNFKYNNIYIHYFDKEGAVRTFLRNLSQRGWEVLNYTSSKIYLLPFDSYQDDSNLNSHKVIGQEFDNVAVVINEYFHYNSNGKLVSSRPAGSADYRMDRMLYQNLTRAREKLFIVIYNNPELLHACLKILNRT